MTTAVAMEAGWQPDPSGRHEYRYFDGTGWTDNVSDGGTAATDPMDPEPVPAATASPPAPPRPQPKAKSKVPIIAAVAAVVVIVVAFLALRGGGGGDEASGTGEVAVHVEPGKVAVRHVKVPKDSVLLVKAIPNGDFDPVLSLAADFPTVDKYKTTFGFNALFGRGAVDTSSSSAFTDTDVSAVKGGLFFVVNDDGPGKPEVLALPAPFRKFVGPATQPDQGFLYMQFLRIAYQDFVGGTSDIGDTRTFAKQSDFTDASDFAVLSDSFSDLSGLPG